VVVALVSRGSVVVRWLDDDGSCAGEAPEISGLLDSLIFGVGELLDKIDDGAPKLRVWDLHECLGELEAIRGSEIVCDIL
jgi:hypothetical protein